MSDDDEMKTAILHGLHEVYHPEGVVVWLTACHKSGPLKGLVPKELIDSGRAAEVLAAVERLVGGAFA